MRKIVSKLKNYRNYLGGSRKRTEIPKVGKKPSESYLTPLEKSTCEQRVSHKANVGEGNKEQIQSNSK